MAQLPSSPRGASRKKSAVVEFQAVVLASVSDGDGLYPLTEELPAALLPVANRPLISFQLELLERAQSFSQVLVVTTEQWKTVLGTWLSERYKGPLEVKLEIVPDDAGSADSLRHIRAKLTTDFVLMAGDVITDVPFQRMADQHRLQGAAATALFREAPAREAGVAKKAKDLDGIDFVGVDETGQRILSLEAAADSADSGIVSISQSMLRKYPPVTLRTDLVDAHVYIFSHWVLDVLEMKPHFSSAKFELLPYLVRKQFLQKDNLPPSHAQPHGMAEAGPPSADADASPRVSGLAMASANSARRQLSHAADFRCCCYLLPRGTAYCQRASTLKEYTQANLDVSRESRLTLYEPAANPESALPKDGNFVLRSCDKDCTVGESVEVGGRSAIKKSCIGPHCRIGSGVKITNCILMDHVVIGDKVTMQNSIVCGNAEVREGASLKDVQVASGVSIEASAVHKGEAITMSERDEMDED
jgi:translation initiation factor eIF-2B subunit gamma